jgi:hypothetical protein
MSTNNKGAEQGIFQAEGPFCITPKYKTLNPAERGTKI